jgi:hypothetical protein
MRNSCFLFLYHVSPLVSLRSLWDCSVANRKNLTNILRSISDVRESVSYFSPPRPGFSVRAAPVESWWQTSHSYWPFIEASGSPERLVCHKHSIFLSVVWGVENGPVRGASLLRINFTGVREIKIERCLQSVQLLAQIIKFSCWVRYNVRTFIFSYAAGRGAQYGCECTSGWLQWGSVTEGLMARSAVLTTGSAGQADLQECVQRRRPLGPAVNQSKPKACPHIFFFNL